MTINEAQITQLEKRARGFRRIISALNDLPMYGITPTIDKILYVIIGELKEHLKKKITRNNQKLNEIHTTSVDSLLDDDGQGGVIGEVRTEPSFVSKEYSSKIESVIKND
jgi:uncharacterized protein YjaG (DUF416 family)|tara:strand:+ start:569 stop:898 length:330 start_codon:yes stop_codon:yes gene_type:complete